MTNSPLAQQFLQFLVAIGFVLFALRLITKMGVGGNAVKQLVIAVLEAIVALLVLPFKLLTRLLKKFCF